MSNTERELRERINSLTREQLVALAQSWLGAAMWNSGEEGVERMLNEIESLRPPFNSDESAHGKPPSQKPRR